jgi:hypothetical protein
VSPNLRETQIVSSRWTIPVLAALTFIVCYLRGFVFPHTPILLWGDQLGFATKGARLLRGELPYRDFFEFLTPGTDLVYAGLFRILGASPWIPNLTMAFLAAAMTAMMTWCAMRLMRGAIVVLPAVLMIGFVLYGSLDATHHWFSTVLIMGAVCVLFNGASALRIAIAGALIGLAASFTQTKGAAMAVGLMVYFIWLTQRESSGAARCWRQCWKRCLLFASSALLIFAAINGPYILAAGVHRWIEEVIVFPARYFGSVPINNWRGIWPEFRHRAGVLKWMCFPFLYCAVPLTYIGFFIAMRRSSRVEADNEVHDRWDRLLLIAIAGIAMLTVMMPALSIRRISCVSPPAMILLAWLLSRDGRLRHCIAIGLGTVSLAVALSQVSVMQLRPGQFVTLPTGRTAIPDAANYEVYRWTAEHTRPGQWYFGLSPFTLPLGLRDAAPVEGLGPGDYSRPEQVAAVITALEKTQPPLMIVLPEQYFLYQQATGANHLQPFYKYLYLHYKRTQRFSNGFEAWERSSE